VRPFTRVQADAGIAGPLGGSDPDTVELRLGHARLWIEHRRRLDRARAQDPFPICAQLAQRIGEDAQRARERGGLDLR
jgi:hypothetical protein